MSDSLITQALDRSHDLLRRASHSWGFAASPDLSQYDALWVRDAAIAVLGAFAIEDENLWDTAVATIRSTTAAIGDSGCVPAVIRPGAGAWDWAEGGAVDASAWYVIMTAAAWETTGEIGLVEESWETVAQALRWLSTQDVTGTRLISAAPSTDWMDSSLVRAGRTLHLNVLYAWAARCGEVLATAVGADGPVDSADLRWRLNALFWPTPDVEVAEIHTHGLMHSAIRESHLILAGRPRSHYLSHVIHAGFIDRCDTLANVLAVLSGVAPADRGRRVVQYLNEAGVDQPYPSRTWDIPVQEPGHMWVVEAEDTQNPRWHNPPHCYHNGGVWPYVGGLHAGAAASLGLAKEASGLLEGAARANHAGDWRFSEWLHGESGEPSGAPSQTWNAGALTFASAVMGKGPGVIPGRP